MSSNDVKNYAFAWEALSRIPFGSTLADRVQSLLRAAINQEEVYSKPPMMAPRSDQQSPDDEIPF